MVSVDWIVYVFISVILIILVSIRYLIVESPWDTPRNRLVLDLAILPFFIFFIVNLTWIAINSN